MEASEILSNHPTALGSTDKEMPKTLTAFSEKNLQTEHGGAFTNNF